MIYRNGKIKADKDWSRHTNWTIISKGQLSKINCEEFEDFYSWTEYSLQSQSETGTNVNRKRSEAPKFTTVWDIDGRLPELTPEYNSSWQQPVTLKCEKLTRIIETQGGYSQKNQLLKVIKQKKLLWANSI